MQYESVKVAHSICGQVFGALRVDVVLLNLGKLMSFCMDHIMEEVSITLPKAHGSHNGRSVHLHCQSRPLERLGL